MPMSIRSSLRAAAVALISLTVACGGGGGRDTTPLAPPARPAPPAFKPTAFAVSVSGAGRPVIFIPGLASPGSVWDGTVAHLGGHVQAHVLTLAGFAGQPPIPPPFLATVHDQLVQYIAANHLDHPIIVGHSLGGAMSLWLAETVADLGGIVDVDGLPFLAASADPTATEQSAAAMVKPIHDKMAAMTQAELAPQMHAFLAGMITKPEDLERIATASAKSDVASYVAAFTELLTKDLRPQLGAIHVPVTVIASTDTGGRVPREQLEASWHAQIDPIEGADLHFVDQARHFVMLDQPAAFYALLDAALARR